MTGNPALSYCLFCRHRKLFFVLVSRAEKQVLNVKGFDVMTDAQANRMINILAEETTLEATLIARTVALLEEGATVPFIARYRKEVTGEMDEVQIRQIQERLEYHKVLNERRETILKSI